MIENQNQNLKPKVNYRLPTNLVPDLYEISIKPYFTVHTVPNYYDGSVLITFICKRQTSKIVLHMNRLDIHEKTIQLKSSDSELITSGFSLNYVQETQFLIIDYQNFYFKENNNYSIRIDFKGYLSNDNAGFYKSFYLDDEGNKKLNINFKIFFLNFK